MKVIVTLFILLFILECYAYDHPGSSNFIETGGLRSKAVYGYEVTTFYGVPKFDYGNLSVEGFKSSYWIYHSEKLKLGPLVSYFFTPYSQKDSAHLSGMKRKGFFELGGVVEASIPFGRLQFSLAKTTHEKDGNIIRLSYATGVPLIPLNGSHIWLNIMLEYASHSSSTSSYLFGVKSSEATSSRPEYNLDRLGVFTSILGLWTPLNKSWWLNLTYKADNFEEEITKSPIVSRELDSTLMLGLMYSF